MKAAALASRAGRSGGFRLATWVLIVAFALQSYVTQTHLHPLASTSASGIAKLSGPGGAKGKSGQDDASDCPFCQALVHSGAFFAPGSPLLALPFQWAHFATPAAIVVAIAARPAWIWQSRAPPHP